MSYFVVMTKSGSFYFIKPHDLFNHYWFVQKIGERGLFFLAGVGDLRTGRFYPGIDLIKSGECKGLMLFFLEDRNKLENLLRQVKNHSLLMSSLGNSTRIVRLFREI